MNAQCVEYQAHLNLPVMRAPALNVGAFACPLMHTQLMSARSPADVYNSNLKAQARIQAQQIDSAIQLLKMQYDAIMASVQQSHNQPLDQPSTQSSTSSQVVDQTSFSTQFDLPGPASEEQVAATSAIDTTSSCKRKSGSQSGRMSITSLASDSCSPNKATGSELQSKKRLRRQ
jgi:hypothetical protein